VIVGANCPHRRLGSAAKNVLVLLYDILSPNAQLPWGAYQSSQMTTRKGVLTTVVND